MDTDNTYGNLEKPIPFMVRQAHRERNSLIYIVPFALSLSKCRVFRGFHTSVQSVTPISGL